jgi:hypothetical protein
MTRPRLSPRTQAWIAIAVTLGIGVLIGMFGTGALAQNRLRNLDDMRRPGGFVEHLSGVIGPRDDAQMDRIRPILEATDRANREIMSGSEEQLRTAFREMVEALVDELDPDQMARLQRFERRPPPPRGVRPGDGQRPPGARPPGGRPPRGGDPSPR